MPACDVQGNMRRVRVEAEYLDAGSWAHARQRFLTFRSKLTLLSSTPEYAPRVESANVYIDSPEGKAPVVVQVQLTLLEHSWADARKTADVLVAEAAQQSGISIVDEPTEEVSLDGVYQEGDLELVGA